MSYDYTDQEQAFLLSKGATVLKSGDEVIYNFGLQPDWKEQTQKLCSEVRQLNELAPHLMGTGEGQDVFAWDFEMEVLKQILDSWDQSSIGSCVSHGWGRAVQDVMLYLIAVGILEEWPGAQVCREAIYGGSRIEIGHSPGGEGSVGSWAAKFVEQYGILLYQKYPEMDLSSGYTVARCREWGDRGVPDNLEKYAKEHPCQVAVVTTPEQIRDAVCNKHFVAICGMTSRTMKRQPGGWCPKTGNNWAHCEEVRGHGIVAGGSKSPWGGDGAHPFVGDTPALVEQNSWGGYLGNENNQVTLASGLIITLPQGCYLSTYAERANDIRDGDTFAVSMVKGWPIQSIDFRKR